MSTEPPASKPTIRLSLLASYITAVAMTACFSVTVIQFLKWLFPTWNVNGMVVVCILAVLEAIGSRRLIHLLPTAESQIIFYRLTEWLLIFIMLKVYVELMQGWGSFLQNLSLWLADFPLNIINTRTILALVAVFIAWLVGNFFDNDLTLLGWLEQDIRDEVMRHISVREIILRRFMGVGMAAVALAGLPQEKVVNLGMQPASMEAIPAVIMYFILGVMLLSLTRYITLASKWRQEKVEIPRQLSRKWMLYSGLIIGALILSIAWLPTGVGLGLLGVLKGIYTAVTVFFTTIWVFFFFLLEALGKLLIPPAKATPTPTPAAPTAPPIVYVPGSEPSAINWALIKTILYWVLTIFLVGLAMRQYLLFHKELREDLKQFRILRWLASLWQRLVASIRGANRSVNSFVQERLKRLRERRAMTPANLWDFINPHRLEPRQRVIFYYLALLRRAGEAGLPRHEGQTPFEYLDSLPGELEEGKPEVQNLTESFVEARYSRHEIPVEKISQVERWWESVRRFLRGKKPPAKES